MNEIAFRPRRRPPQRARYRLRRADPADSFDMAGRPLADPPECYGVVHVDRWHNGEVIDCFSSLAEATTAALEEARKRQCLFSVAWEIAP